MSETQPSQGSNGYDADELGRFIDAIDREHDELDRLKSDYMIACKGPRGRIREVMKSVKEASIPLVPFREALTQHLFERKSVKRIEDMEPDDQASFEMIMSALGADFAETPLGQSALAKARPARDGDAALKSL